MKRLILSLMTVISFVLQPAVSYAATLQGMSYPYSATTVYNLARGNNSYKLSTLSRRDMDVTNQYGDTALCLAVRNHDKEAYNALLDAGANPNPRCMDSLEPMRPTKAFSSIFTPKLGYVFGLIAVGGGAALAAGGGGGGSRTCSGYKKADCPEAYHISEICEEDTAYHKCAINTTNTPENCYEIVLNKDECLSCKPEYYRDVTDCKIRTKTAHCAELVDTEDACLICENGYYLEYGSCYVGNIDNCSVYASKSACQTCEEGFVLSVNKDACVRPIEHCNTYAKDGTCSTCDIGYVRSKDSLVCFKKIDHCSIYEDDGSCNSCLSNYAVTKYKDKCVSFIDRCQVYEEDGTCEICETGFTQSQDRFHCVRDIPGCTVYNEDGACITCDSENPILYEGKCYTKDSYCYSAKKYNQKACAQPQIKDYCELPNGETNEEYWLCIDGPVGCKKSNPDTGVCEECATGYYLDEGVCYAQDIPGCDIYVLGENKCETCQNKFYKDEDGLCHAITINNCEENDTNENTCYRCGKAYYPDNDKTVCTKIAYCVDSDGTANECKECDSTHVLDEHGACISEQAYCEAEEHGKTEACEDWQEPEACVLPDHTESQTYHSCINKEIENCVETNEDGSCAKCIDTHFVDNGGATCSPITVPNCTSGDGTHDKCEICNTGYYVDEGVCYAQNVPECQVHVYNENKCQQCDPKYYVTGSGTCEQISSFDLCLNSEGIENKCAECNHGGYYVNSDGQCEEIANCKISNGKNACTTCDGDNAYYVDGGNCSQNTECAKTNGQTSACTECPEDKPILDGTCYSEAAYCAKKGYTRNIKQKNCNADYQSTSMCVLPKGAESNTYGICTAKNVSHCEEQEKTGDDVGKCLLCANKYILDNGICKGILNCETSNGKDKCTKCKTDGGYILNDDHTECTKIAHCVETNGVDTCKSCNSPYQPIGNTCYEEQAYCANLPEPYTATSCDSSSEYPEFCPWPGGDSTYRRCVGDSIEGCVQYNQNPGHPNECTQCDSGYYLDGTTCSAQPTQFGCKTYKTDAKGCDVCYSGFTKNNSGTCERNPEAKAGDYYYRVSNYNADDQETTQTRTSAMIKIVDESGGDDIYTIIGFTSANVGDGSQAGIATQDGHSSDTTTNATQYYTEYDVHNTSFEDDGTQITSKIELDGSQISVGDKLINNIAAGSGQFIGLSSPGTVTDNSFAFAGNANVYNAAGWYNSTNRTGYIGILYKPLPTSLSDNFKGFNVYGIMSANKAYNAYADITKSEQTVSGQIEIYSKNATDNYGIYATKNAYNAYGRGAVGIISMYSLNNNAQYIGISSEINAYNSAYNGKGTIKAEKIMSEPGQINNPVIGMQVLNGNAYNAYYHDIYSETSQGIINLRSPYSVAMQATSGGNLYNAYGDKAYANITKGDINLPYGGVAFKTSGTAYNAYNGSGTVSIGESLENSSDIYTICKDCAYFYNSHGTGSKGEINIYGNIDTITKFINSDEDGEGIVNIYTYEPNSDLTDNTLNVISNDGRSSNGNNGHINVYLGSGWVNVTPDAPYNIEDWNASNYSINPLNGVALTGNSTITITNKQVDTDDHDAFVKEIVGVKDSYMSDSANITIATDWPNDGVYDVSEPLTEILEAHHIYGIQNPTQDITGGTINIQARLFSFDSQSQTGYAYGIYDGRNSGDVYTSNANINMQILGAEEYERTMNETAYGLYNVNNGASGNIYLDSYLYTYTYIDPDTGEDKDKKLCIDNMIGMYGNNVTMQNAGTIAIGTNHQTGILVETQSGYVNDAIIGMFGQGEHVTNMENSGNTGNIAINSAWYRNVRGIWADDISSSGNITNSGNIIITAGAQYEESDERNFEVYGILSQNRITNIENSGTIQISSLQARDDDIARGDDDIARGDIYGIYAGSGASTQLATATNTGTIEIQINQKSTNQNIYGMWGGSYVDLYNGENGDYNNATINITATKTVNNIIGMQTTGNPELAGYQSKAYNYGNINILAMGEANNVFGMSALNRSEAYNYGDIDINVADPQGCVFGMYADHHSKIENHGTINIKVNGSRVEKAGGLLATNYSFLLNKSDAKINITVVPRSAEYSWTKTINNVTEGAEGIYYFSYNGGVNVSPTAAFVIDETSQIVNEGTITSQAAVNITGGGRMLMSRGAKLVAPSITGTLTLASDIVSEGNEDVYTTTGLVTGNSDDVTVESESAMFTASTVVNDDDDNSVDGVLTRRSFDTMVQSAALANYLEDNYTGDNAQEFFATLKTASSASEFDEILSKELGLCLMPNFAQENFNVFRSLGNLITDNLFSKEMTDERMMVGYDYLALSRDTKKKVTGYENTSNSSYFLGDIKLDKRSRFGLGLSITKFNSDYDDDSDRDEMFAQLLASYMYDFGNKWRYAGVLHSGYGWGDYTRKLNHGDVDGNLHDFIYGLQNEFRYGIETPYVTLEPQVEMNFTGYYQRRINEEHKNGSIIMKGTNNFSAESGIGLYASKEFNLEKYGKFKGRVGGSYYHEWAHPYGSIKSRMRGTDGWYKIESDDIFERDRFMISADVTYTYKMFDLYVRGSQYFEKDTVAVFNAGLKYNF